MTRNPKALGLVLVAMLALGAMGAQSAPAAVEHSFHSGASKTVLTGQSEWGDHILTSTAGFELKCSSVAFEGTVVGTNSDTMTVHPQYSGCKLNGGAATITTNGCNFVFGSTTTASSHWSSSEEHATMSIECEPGHHIAVTGPGCNLTLSASHNSAPVNQSLHGLTYIAVTHNSKDSLTMRWTLRTTHYTVLPGSFCGLAGHPAGTYTNGFYDGRATLTGYGEGVVLSGTTTKGRTWSHGSQVDIEVGKPMETEDPPPAEQHNFAIEDETTVLTGHSEKGEKHFFSAAGVPIECGTAAFQGTIVASVHDTITVHPSYSECKGPSGEAITVKTSGCNYILDSDTTYGPYSEGPHAAMNIECEEEHDITISVGSCTLRFDSKHGGNPVNQSLHGLSYSVINHSSKHSVTVRWTVSMVHYTASGASCESAGISPGTHTDGTYAGSAEVTVYDESTVTGGSTTGGFTWSHGAQVGVTVSTAL
jgi:hypothetical protein